MRDERSLELNGEVISKLVSAAKGKNAADGPLLSGLQEVCAKARLRTAQTLEEDVLQPISRQLKTGVGNRRQQRKTRS